MFGLRELSCHSARHRPHSTLTQSLKPLVDGPNNAHTSMSFLLKTLAVQPGGSLRVREASDTPSIFEFDDALASYAAPSIGIPWPINCSPALRLQCSSLRLFYDAGRKMSNQRPANTAESSSCRKPDACSWTLLAARFLGCFLRCVPRGGGGLARRRFVLASNSASSG